MVVEYNMSRWAIMRGVNRIQAIFVWQYEQMCFSFKNMGKLNAHQNLDFSDGNVQDKTLPLHCDVTVQKFFFLPSALVLH